MHHTYTSLDKNQKTEFLKKKKKTKQKKLEYLIWKYKSALHMHSSSDKYQETLPAKVKGLRNQNKEHVVNIESNIFGTQVS